MRESVVCIVPAASVPDGAPFERVGGVVSVVDEGGGVGEGEGLGAGGGGVGEGLGEGGATVPPPTPRLYNPCTSVAESARL